MKKWLKDNQAILLLMTSGLLLMGLAFFRLNISIKSKHLLSTTQENSSYESSNQIPAIAPTPDPEGTSKNDKTIPKSEFEYSLEYIQNTVKAYQKYFQKCYTLALQKEQNTKGSTTLKFEITETGVVSKSQIINNNIQIVGFESCVLEALSRIPFRSHQGGPVQAVLPLTFE